MPMRRGVYQDLVALIVEPHRRETDPVVRTDQTQSHSDRLIEQPFVLWIEITQARRPQTGPPAGREQHYEKWLS